MNFDETYSIEREINYRRMVLRAAKNCGCSHLPSISEISLELAELEQIRANREAIQGGVK